MPLPIGIADWRRTRELYRQLSEIVYDKKVDVLPDDLTGSLAANLARVIASYEGAEQAFIEELFEQWSEIDSLTGVRHIRFRKLYTDQRLDRFGPYHPPGNQRRRPKPFEAAVETARRLVYLNALRDVFEITVQSAAILGGSLSYGRFYNVYGAHPAGGSDVDILLVIQDHEFLDEVRSALGQCPGVDLDTLKLLERRSRTFNKLRKAVQYRGNPMILSHKVTMWYQHMDPILADTGISGDYTLSLHIMDRETFNNVILTSVPIIEAPPNNSQLVQFLYDYREDRPKRDYIERSFSGRTLIADLKPRSESDGCIATVPVCTIREERYYPGLHQNLIVPQFEIRWQTPGVRIYLPVLAFRWKLSERLRFERMLRPFELQNLCRSHSRNEVFAPHVTARANQE